LNRLNTKSPAQYVFANRKWFSENALAAHIREELTGVNTILESGDYDISDTQFLWENIDTATRFENARMV